VDPIHVMKIMIDFNKMVFERTYTVMALMQEETEKVMAAWLERNQLVQEGEKKTIYDWVETSKRNRNEFKEKIDQGYHMMETFLLGLKRQGTAPDGETH
jgi:hypothetical protein